MGEIASAGTTSSAFYKESAIVLKQERQQHTFLSSASSAPSAARLFLFSFFSFFCFFKARSPSTSIITASALAVPSSGATGSGAIEVSAASDFLFLSFFSFLGVDSGAILVIYWFLFLEMDLSNGFVQLLRRRITGLNAKKWAAGCFNPHHVTLDGPSASSGSSG